jgi:ribonuclease Z
MLAHLAFQKRSILFDLGDLSAVPAADLLKVDHIFVTHTHMDHFIGFDQILRLFLGRPKHLHIYGPAGFLNNVAGKLAGYTWNLVQHYDEALVIEATEVEDNRKLTQIYDCRSGFKPIGPPKVFCAEKFLHQEPELSIGFVILDHQIPCLAFNLQENFHINILKNQLSELGIAAGPWLKALKKLIYDGADPLTEVIAPSTAPKVHEVKYFTVKELSSKIVRISQGQKIAYVTDAAYTSSNEEKIIFLSRGADHLFIEAPFLEIDRDIAKSKHHLTAQQAGLLAKAAEVRKMTIFHYSPRYSERSSLLEAEARNAFEGLV